MNDQTRDLVFLIRTPRVTVPDVIPAYQAGLSQHTVDWGAVHTAILHRWSHSTLYEIRTAARKGRASKGNSRMKGGSERQRLREPGCGRDPSASSHTIY
jgi:hypothetical protein